MSQIEAGHPFPKRIKTSLKPDQYYADQHQKRQIVLHHSASASVRYMADWFNSNSDKIATAYGIDPDGTIYELFDPSGWAFHTGCGAEVDKYNIGIEIANVGHLRKRGKEFFSESPANGQFIVPYLGEVYDHGLEWRGFRYFAKYTDEQTISAAMLCAHLVKQFKMNNYVLTDFGCKPEYVIYKGIVKHCNVFAGKLDVSPAFDYGLFLDTFEKAGGRNVFV